jgi:glutaredoxin|tara:strand:- start:2302 stop:2535 length:234 start_codon:yes stop_codon:yes gene_type:complete
MYKVYGKAWCVYCDRAKTLLKNKGLEFIYFDIEKDDQFRKWAQERSGGQTSVPIIFDGDDNHIGGFEELRNRLKEQK